MLTRVFCPKKCTCRNQAKQDLMMTMMMMTNGLSSPLSRAIVLTLDNVYTKNAHTLPENTPTHLHYRTIMPKVKELVSLLAVSNSCKEQGMVVEAVLDKLILEEKADSSSQKPPPRVGVVSSCPVGKLRKTKVSGWSG